MKYLETGKVMTYNYDTPPSPEGLLSAGIPIFDRDIPGYIRADQIGRKTGIWPFRRGTYDVSVTTLTGSLGSLSTSGNVKAPLIENGRFSSVRAAVKEGLKIATLKKR